MKLIFSLFIAIALLHETIRASTVNLNAGWPGVALSGTPCAAWDVPIVNPSDYNDPRTTRPVGTAQISHRQLVETAHFTPEVEQLKYGRTSGHDPSGDINYTLNKFPNHPRALWAMSRYYLRKIQTNGLEAVELSERAPKSGNSRLPPPECYFQRAKAFVPEDKYISTIFGIYLHRRGMLDSALAEYQLAESEYGNNPELIYNMGLLYLDLNQPDKAKDYAERARTLGYPLNGLSKKIERRERNANKPNDTNTHAQ